MKLNFNQIKEIITGTARIAEENGIVELYRFTKEQEELYKVTNQDFYNKTFSSAGIKLLFKTDSKKLFLKVIATQGSSRKYFSVDVLIDGKPIGYLDNFSNTILPRNYTKVEFPLGEFSKEFQLGDGTKTVCIHMPWSTKTSIKEIVIDDGAFVEAVKKKTNCLHTEIR